MKKVLLISQSHDLKDWIEALTGKCTLFMCSDFKLLASLVQNQRFDLVLLDMPYAASPEPFVHCYLLVRKNILNFPFKSIVLVKNPGELQQLKQAGFDQWFQKPVNPFYLAGILNN